jgi:CubicO group peptidase (beta-lactamase class C family)
MVAIRFGLLAILCAGWLAACGGGGGGGDSDGGGSDGGGYRAGEDGGAAVDITPGAQALVSVNPDNLGDGWQVSTPDVQSINGLELQRRLDELRTSGSGGIDGVVVVRNDRLVAEAYFNGYARETQHDMRSVTKSFTASLAGIAIEQGLITLDDTLAQHITRFGDFDHMDERKRSIRVANVLNMQTGLDCDDGRDSSPGNESFMYRHDDWIKYVMSVPTQADPGTLTSYCSGAVTVLGSIIAAKSGQKLEDFAVTHLLAPLNMSSVRWLHSPLGVTNASSAIQLRPRDAAKFGSLFLNGGRWYGSQVVPQTWVERSQQTLTAIRGEGYGWLWWKSFYYVRGAVQPGMYASGNGGNYIFVIPGERLVVVITASNYNRNGPSQGFLRDSILPTIE